MKTVSYDGKWKGEVVFFDPLTIQQEAEWELALGAYAIAREKRGGDSAQVLSFLPAIIACVSEWHLDGLPERMTVQNFPRRPRIDRANLVAFLVKNISEIYIVDDPNE